MALVSFDLDGVIERNPFQSRRPDGVYGHITRELAPYLPDMPPEEARRAILKMIFKEHLALMGAGRLVEAHDWDAIFATIAHRLGYPGVFDVSQLVTHYARNPEICYLYPGAQECLAALARADYTLISTTNGFRSYQEPVMRQLGVLDFFEAVITPDAVGAAKPEVAIFRAGERYGKPRIHIGDTLPHDVTGARRAGWMSIYIVQMGAPGATELPAELAELPAWERPAVGMDWLRHRLELERRWYPYPPTRLAACIPDAIVQSLAEVPETVEYLIRESGRQPWSQSGHSSLPPADHGSR